jgi:hypothetical protein
MGYVHSWDTQKRIPLDAFAAIAKDFAKLLPEFTKAGIQLAGPSGKGQVLIDSEKISFNGKEHCGHTKEDLGITFPAADSGGIHKENTGADKKSETLEIPSDKEVFKMPISFLKTRACGGDCSHETMKLQRVSPEERRLKIPEGASENMVGMKEYLEQRERLPYSYFCKTAYKPYDIAVTALLLIAKHHLQDRIFISSDGQDQHWFDAKLICQKVLNYGLEYKFQESSGSLVSEKEIEKKIEQGVKSILDRGI